MGSLNTLTILKAVLLGGDCNFILFWRSVQEKKLLLVLGPSCFGWIQLWMIFLNIFDDSIILLPWFLSSVMNGYSTDIAGDIFGMYEI